MITTKQISFWDSIGKRAPPDQVLSIGTHPSLNLWEEVPYKFEQPYTRFTFGVFKTGIFAGTTRFFICQSPWDSTDFLVSGETERVKKQAPYLKSQLQKAIRRNLTEAACHAAWTLLKHEPLKLLRRLPIIMVEDKKVHEDLPLLVWGMLKLSKEPQWQIPMPFVHRVMCLVADLAEGAPVDPTRALSGKVPTNNNGDILKLSPREKAIVLSLIIRADYGGTKGDKKLLMNEAHWWTFKSLETIPSSMEKSFYPLPDISMDNHWIPFAFDFHVTKLLPWLCDNVPSLDEIIKKHDPRATKLNYVDILQSAVWFFYSSLRYCPICDETRHDCGHQLITEAGRKSLPLWKSIEPHVLKFAADKIEENSGPKRKRMHH